MLYIYSYLQTLPRILPHDNYPGGGVGVGGAKSELGRRGGGGGGGGGGGLAFVVWVIS